MILPIQTVKNNPILRRKALKVKKIDIEIKRLILDMKKTMEKENGVGLAAPQVGQSLQIIIVKPEQKITVLINPQIKKLSKKTNIMEEGCLSLPGRYYFIKRPAKIKVRGLSQDGQKVKIKADGLLARIIQHEIDHLDGILITDRFYEN